MNCTSRIPAAEADLDVASASAPCASSSSLGILGASMGRFGRIAALATMPRRRELGRVAALATIPLMVGACQGPWEYWPNPPAAHRGIWVSGHVVAGWPIKSICFEKLNALGEYHTDAFAFYDSASIRVSGDFGSGNTTLALVPQTASPNCFDGPTDAIPMAANAYDLEATILWDSAGENVTSHLRATAHIPTRFAITGAIAPSQALLGTSEMDPAAVEALITAFGDTLLEIASDTMALAAFFADNQEQIDEILAHFRTPYQSGDTVFYLTGSASLSSHYFTNDRSEDVQGVLATSRFDSTSGQGGTPFDNIFGEPDTAEYTVEGNKNRLLYMADFDLGNGRSYLDTIPLVNSWFYPGFTTFFFYAVESAYNQYALSAIEQEEDTRISKVYNVEGGAGFFAGMIVDSFLVYTDTIPGTPFYSFVRARILTRQDEGWLSSKACRAYWPQFCGDSGWTSSGCEPLAISNYLDTTSDVDVQSLGLTLQDAALDSAIATGSRLHCIASGFPTDDATCNEPRELCLEATIANNCNVLLWAWCEDRSWSIDTYSQCGTALASYVNILQPSSSVLERERNRWCAAHPSDPQCGS